MTDEELYKLYPYAFAHNAMTGELAIPLHALVNELPAGWHKLFWQCMEDIRQPLIEAGQLGDFYFLQVKEKYGELRLYSTTCIKNVDSILNRYMYVSNFICEDCGKPATKETQGWIIRYCDKCAKPYIDQCTDIAFDPTYTYITYSKNRGEVVHNEDVSDIWDRLYKEKDND